MLNRTLLNGFLPVQAARGLGLFMLDRVPVLRQALMRRGVAGAGSVAADASALQG